MNMDSQAASAPAILSSAEKRLGLPSISYRPCWNKRHVKKPSFDPFRELSLKFPKKSQLISQLRETHPGIEFREALFTVITDEVTPNLGSFSFGSNVTEKYKDEVYMKSYKVIPCREPDCDAEFCFNFHGSEDRRRLLIVHSNGLWSYKPDLCRGGKVCMGEDCTLAHSKNEVDYHPMKYKTLMCANKCNPLGLCRLGIHCPNAHETGELRLGSPNIINLSKSVPASHSLPVTESQVPKPDPEYQISSLSLNELSKINLSTTTHRMIEELQTVQHERMRYDLMLKETKGKLAAAEKRVSCAFCQTRKRSRLLSCGHCVCESCAETIAKECGICQAPLAQVVKLKTGRCPNNHKMDPAMEVPVLRYMSSIEMPRSLDREDSVLPQGGKLYRVLAVATNEADLERFGYTASYERGTAFKYPEQPGKSQLAIFFKTPEWAVPLPQTLHVLLLVISSEADIERLTAIAQAHAYCSQKYVTGRLEEQTLTFARQIGAVYKAPDVIETLPLLLNVVEEEERHIMELVGSVFTEFDKDKSGFIDVHEIEAMASQLGTSVNAEEVRVIMEEVDTDKDGRISKEEFTKWWLKGRKGKSKIMRELTSTVTKAKGFLQRYGPDVRRMMGGTDIQSKEKSAFSFKLTSGVIEHPGLQSRIHVSLGESAAFKAQVDPNDLRDIMFVVAFKINDGVDAEALRTQVEGFVQQGLRILADSGAKIAELVNEIYAKVSLVDDKLVIGLVSQGGEVLQELEKEYSHFRRLITACDFEQTIDLSLKLEASPESMSGNEDRLLIEHFLDGLELNVDVTIWRFYRELLAWGLKKTLGGHEQFFFLLTLLSEGEVNISLDEFDLLPSHVVATWRKMIERRMPFLLIKNLKNAKKMSAGLASLPLILSVNETFLNNCSSAKVDLFGKFFDISWTGSVCLPNLSSLIRF